MSCYFGVRGLVAVVAGEDWLALTDASPRDLGSAEVFNIVADILINLCFSSKRRLLFSLALGSSTAGAK